MERNHRGNMFAVKWTEERCFVCYETSELSSHSFQYLSRYLNLEWGKTINEPLELGQYSYDKTERPYLNVELCTGCAYLIETFSEQFRQLEKLEMEMTSSLSLIQEKLVGRGAESDTNSKSNSTYAGNEKHKSVEALRLAVLQKCHSKLRNSRPRIKVQKLTLPEVKMEEEMFETKPDYIANSSPEESAPSFPELDMASENIKVEEPSQVIIKPTVNENMDNYLKEEGEGQDDFDMDAEHPAEPRETAPSNPAASPPVKKMPEPIIDKLTGKSKCFLCLKIFDDKSTYQAHYSNKHLACSIKCESCGKKLKNLESLKRHQQIVHNPKRYHCQQCSKTFSSPGYLSQHQKASHLGEQFQCAFCSKSFSASWNKDRHMRLECRKKK